MKGNWSQLEIAGKAADVYEPPVPGRPRFAVVHLHGVGLETLHDKPAFTRLFEKLDLACICPHGQRSWWGDRICAEFDEAVTPERYLLEQLLPFIRARWNLQPPAIGLQGISMGGQGALRLAFKHADLFPVVAGIASAVDYHDLYGEGTPLDALYGSKEECRQDTATLHVHPSHYPPHIFFCVDPEDDIWFRGNDRLHEKLNALGVPHETDFTTRAGGHSWDYFNHMAARVEQFVVTGLEQQSRRLL
jgi:S-formylglutathione hydrolase